MKYLRYAWTVFLATVALVVIILIFSKDLEPSQRIAVSLLVMIYLNLVIGHAILVQQMGKMGMALGGHFLRLEKRFAEGTAEEIEDGEELLRELNEKNRVVEVKFYINAVFSAVGYFIALANLIGAL